MLFWCDQGQVITPFLNKEKTEYLLSKLAESPTTGNNDNHQ